MTWNVGYLPNIQFCVMKTEKSISCQFDETRMN